MRTEPPVSEPRPAAAMRAAIALPVPPEEPPAMRVGSYALRAGPNAALLLVMPKASSCILVFPSTSAPARISFSATGALRVGTKPLSPGVPAELGRPATWMLSFTTMGTPWSGPAKLLRAARESALRAAASARSRSNVMKALRSRLPSTTSTRAFTRSSLFKVPARMRAAASVADSSVRPCAPALAGPIAITMPIAASAVRTQVRSMGGFWHTRRHDASQAQRDRDRLRGERTRGRGAAEPWVLGHPADVGRSAPRARRSLSHDQLEHARPRRDGEPGRPGRVLGGPHGGRHARAARPHGPGARGDRRSLPGRLRLARLLPRASRRGARAGDLRLRTRLPQGGCAPAVERARPGARGGAGDARPRGARRQPGGAGVGEPPPLGPGSGSRRARDAGPGGLAGDRRARRDRRADSHHRGRPGSAVHRPLRGHGEEDPRGEARGDPGCRAFLDPRPAGGPQPRAAGLPRLPSGLRACFSARVTARAKKRPAS